MKRLTEADCEEIINSIKVELDRFKAEFIGVAPDWEPLHKLIPREWWDGWMFMHSDGDIRCYKHGITRRYLNIGVDGKCYVYRGKRKGWIEVDSTAAIDTAYHGIEQLGETRASKYNAAYRARKDAALARLGYTAVR
jgi:hypothetical protein